MADETNNRNAVFKFYLNRQGVKGNKGEKGEQGFSPVIEVSENTANSYKLQITTETDQFETPNLKGNEIDTSQGGSYIRYNEETQQMYVGAADSASTTQAGMIKIASDEDIANLSENAALTPDNLVNNAGSILQSSDSSISITQDPDTLKIDLKANVAGDISRLEARVSADEILLGSHQISIDNLDRDKVDKVIGKGLSTNDFTNADKDKLDSSLQPTSVDGTTIGLNAGGQLTLLAQIPTVPTNISAFTNDSGYITGITSPDIIAALGYTPYDSSNPNGYTSNVGTVTSVNNVSPVSGNVTISIPTDTSDLTNGAGFISSVPTATTSSLGLVQPDGTTITINNGVISSSGGSITVDQTYNPTSANAQSGVAINGANFVCNQAGANNSLEIKNNGSSYQRCVGILGAVNGSGAISIGYRAEAPAGGITIGQSAGLSSSGSSYGIAIGDAARAGYAAIAIGSNGNTGAFASGISSIQLGAGTNNDANTFQVGNYKMLNLSTGFIPAARIAVDGNTITVNSSGQLEASGGSAPTNMVTTDTEQTISGHKIFSDSTTEIAGDLYITQVGTSYIRMGDNTAYATPVLTMDDTNDIFTVGDTGKFLKLKAYNNVVVSNQRGNEFTVGYDTLTYKKSDDTVVDLLALEARIAALEAQINGGNA